MTAVNGWPKGGWVRAHNRQSNQLMGPLGSPKTLAWIDLASHSHLHGALRAQGGIFDNDRRSMDR
jgi:hypothetical protein